LFAEQMKLVGETSLADEVRLIASQHDLEPLLDAKRHDLSKRLFFAYREALCSHRATCKNSGVVSQHDPSDGTVSTVLVDADHEGRPKVAHLALEAEPPDSRTGTDRQHQGESLFVPWYGGKKRRIEWLVGRDGSRRLLPFKLLCCEP